MTLNMGYGIEIPYFLLIVLLSLTLQITTKLDRRVKNLLKRDEGCGGLFIFHSQILHPLLTFRE